MFHPNLEEFKKLTRQGNLIPVYKEILADMETPVSAFYKIAGGERYSYLLESVEGGERLGRYSFLSSGPSLIFKSKGKKVSWETMDGKSEEKETDNPLGELKKLMKKYKPVKLRDLPRFFGGALGYISYDMVRFFERIPDKNPDDLKMDDAVFVVTDTMLIFDHLNHKIKVVSCAYVDGQGRMDIETIYKEACRKVDVLIRKLKQPVDREKITHSFEIPAEQSRQTALFMNKVKSNFTQKGFEKAVEKTKEYIKAGDIIQGVISQRFAVDISVEPFDIYRSLRMVNPSSYMFYLDFEDMKMVGSSPEILVRLEDGLIENRPIAGTRPRGGTEEQDKKLAEELLADPKELAEHIMLVDLGRNDVGRVAEYKTVHVPELMVIERYSHVQHIVSDVKGKLLPGKDAFDVLEACFPAGTVSGAPKIRAMEIIDEVEPTRRGPYAGCVGYFSFSGNLDTCITIRTIVIKNGRAYIQAGAGIVADSQPAKEYVETLNKARALIKAIEMAEEGLE
jgi:anthranilate synthase component I